MHSSGKGGIFVNTIFTKERESKIKYEYKCVPGVSLKTFIRDNKKMIRKPNEWEEKKWFLFTLPYH